MKPEHSEIAIWILGIVNVLLTSGICALVKILYSTEKRLTRLETLMELNMRNAALVLHSPHTPELDALLEEYSDRKELSPTQWKRLKELTDVAMSDREETHGYRHLAAAFSALAEHKLMGIRRQEEMEGLITA